MAFLIHTNYHLPRENLPDSSQFSYWVSTALYAAKKRRGEICILLVDEAEGRKLNHRYRQKDYATNVLSFPVELTAGVKSSLLGDIVICCPIIAHEAAVQSKEITHHYAHMVIHGTLHLLGFDHDDNVDAERMEALEIKILAKLGITNPYN